MKKIFILIIISIIMSCFVVNGVLAVEQTYKWKMSQPYPEGSLIYNQTEAFIKRVEEASNGRIKITHYPSDLLGDYVTQQEGVASGGQELCYTWPVTTMDPRWDVLGIGYIGWNARHGYKTFGPNGWMNPIVDEIAADCNWKVLSIVPSGSSISSDSVISNESYDPLDPQGRKIRVQSSKNYTLRYSAIGYSPVTMPMSEVSSALALGTIDASAGCIPPEFIIYGDAFSYLYMYSDVLYPFLLIMNLDTWNSLSESDQKILLDTAEMADDPDFGWEANYIDIIRNYEEDLLPWQIIVSPDGDQWAQLAEKTRKVEWPYIEKLVGKEMMDIIRMNAEPLPWGLTVDEMEYGFGKILTSEWLIERQGGVYTKNPPPVQK